MIKLYHGLSYCKTDFQVMNDEFNVPLLEAGKYRHYKSGEYEVLGVGCHEVTHEYFVVY